MHVVDAGERLTASCNRQRPEISGVWIPSPAISPRARIHTADFPTPEIRRPKLLVGVWIGDSNIDWRYRRP